MYRYKLLVALILYQKKLCISNRIPLMEKSQFSKVRHPLHVFSTTQIYIRKISHKLSIKMKFEYAYDHDHETPSDVDATFLST